jgi:uncharacterized alpha-E superfamily protein
VAGISADVELLDGASLASAAFERCTFSTEYRTSIVSCIRIARSNALSVRAELTTEVWEASTGSTSSSRRSRRARSRAKGRRRSCAACAIRRKRSAASSTRRSRTTTSGTSCRSAAISNARR